MHRELVESIEYTKNALADFGFARQHKARVAILLDISGSMDSDFVGGNKFFRDGSVAKLIQQVMSIAYHFDDNREIDIFPFGKICHEPLSIPINEFAQLKTVEAINQKIANHLKKNTIQEALEGGTNYGAAVKKVREHYFHDSSTSLTEIQPHELPVYAVFATDGNCTDKAAAKAQFDSSAKQPIFFKILGLLSETGISEDFPFLQNEIDDAPIQAKSSGNSWCDFLCRNQGGKFIDNADVKYIKHPKNPNAKDAVNINIQTLLDEIEDI